MAESMQIRSLHLDHIDEVAPLWEALYEHHMAMGGQITELTSAVEVQESWRRRRRLYEQWLADPGAFGLIAKQAGQPVGYAIVRVHNVEAATTWEQAGRVAVLETLSVKPTARSGGVGSALVAAVKNRLAAEGIAALDLDVVATNHEAIRFYERHGFRTAVTRMMSRIDPNQDITDERSAAAAVRRAGTQPDWSAERDRLNAAGGGLRPRAAT